MKSVELMIFDLDGTLVDSREDIANAVNHTLREIGLKEKSMEEISSYIGTGMEGLIRKSIDGKTDCCFEDALSIMSEYYKKHSLDNTHLFPGVRDILEHFKSKRKIIITNRKREFTIEMLKALDIDGYFEYVAGGDDIGCMKPSSCPLEKAMQKFKINKDKTIIIGDMHIDILAGKKAGIITCAVTYGIGKRDDIVKAKPDYMIDEIARLKEIIN